MTKVKIDKKPRTVISPNSLSKIGLMFRFAFSSRNSLITSNVMVSRIRRRTMQTTTAKSTDCGCKAHHTVSLAQRHTHHWMQILNKRSIAALTSSSPSCCSLVSKIVSPFGMPFSTSPFSSASIRRGRTITATCFNTVRGDAQPMMYPKRQTKVYMNSCLGSHVLSLMMK